ncbi:Vitamin B12 import system permease protein btuC [Agrobacterium tumefaciens]|nr:Vitamin B12 import system permease protein btuC [Agrobacterium tumefaciens]
MFQHGRRHGARPGTLYAVGSSGDHCRSGGRRKPASGGDLGYPHADRADGGYRWCLTFGCGRADADHPVQPACQPLYARYFGGCKLRRGAGACRRRGDLSGAVHYMVPINAFIMAMIAALFIHFASTMRGVTVETIVLLGIALVFTFNAALSLLEYLASEQALAAVVFWTMGSLTKATWDKVYITAAILVVTVPLFMRQAWALTALRLGDDKAASMGINVRRLRLTTMLTVSLLAAIPVSFVGTIGFVGLVGPHIARMVVGEDQRFFLPGSIICGALLLSATSVISKILIPGAILPIGVITALVGVPFFFALIFGNRRRAW